MLSLRSPDQGRILYEVHLVSWCLPHWYIWPCYNLDALLSLVFPSNFGNLYDFLLLLPPFGHSAGVFELLRPKRDWISWETSLRAKKDWWLVVALQKALTGKPQHTSMASQEGQLEDHEHQCHLRLTGPGDLREIVRRNLQVSLGIGTGTRIWISLICTEIKTSPTSVREG